MFVLWLRDPVCDIRDAACRLLGCTVGAHSACLEALKNNAEFAALVSDSSYQYRKVWLAAVVHVSQAGGEAATSHFLPKLLELCSDVVPNVRMCAVRSLQKLVPTVEKRYVDQSG